MANNSKSDLTALFALQTQDKQLDQLQQKIDHIPSAIESIRATLATAKLQLDELHQRFLKVQAGKKEKEIEMADKEAAIKKHEKELNQIKSNNAYKALMSEIAKAKDAVSVCEDGILNLMEDIDDLGEEEKKIKQSLKDLEADCGKKILGLEEQKKGLELEFAAQSDVRQGKLAGIPEEMLQRYDNLRKRKHGVAMVAVSGGSCGGCGMTLPQQIIIDVIRAERIVQCESCQRILYKADAHAASPASQNNA